LEEHVRVWAWAIGSQSLLSIVGSFGDGFAAGLAIFSRDRTGRATKFHCGVPQIIELHCENAHVLGSHRYRLRPRTALRKLLQSFMRRVNRHVGAFNNFGDHTVRDVE
jgi:hypothetical protein